MHLAQVWWKVGAAKLQGGVTLNWGGIEGFRIAGKQGIGVIAACQVIHASQPGTQQAVAVLAPIRRMRSSCSSQSHHLRRPPCLAAAC